MLKQNVDCFLLPRQSELAPSPPHGSEPASSPPRRLRSLVSRSAYDKSSPLFCRISRATYQTIINRMPDIFAAGYGSVYTPPPAERIREISRLATINTIASIWVARQSHFVWHAGWIESRDRRRSHDGRGSVHSTWFGTTAVLEYRHFGFFPHPVDITLPRPSCERRRSRFQSSLRAIQSGIARVPQIEAIVLIVANRLISRIRSARGGV